MTTGSYLRTTLTFLKQSSITPIQLKCRRPRLFQLGQLLMISLDPPTRCNMGHCQASPPLPLICLVYLPAQLPPSQQLWLAARRPNHPFHSRTSRLPLFTPRLFSPAGTIRPQNQTRLGLERRSKLEKSPPPPHYPRVLSRDLSLGMVLAEQNLHQYQSGPLLAGILTLSTLHHSVQADSAFTTSMRWFH